MFDSTSTFLYTVTYMDSAYCVRFPWYDLEEDKETGTVLYRHDSETTFTPEELLGMILNHSRGIAEKFAGELDIILKLFSLLFKIISVWFKLIFCESIHCLSRSPNERYGAYSSFFFQPS